MPSMVVAKSSPVRKGSGEKPSFKSMSRTVSQCLEKPVRAGFTHPVPATVTRTTQGACHRTKSDMSALALELLSHLNASLSRQIHIPARSHRQARREHGSIRRFADSKRTILETQPFESQSFDRTDIANTRAGRTSHEPGLLFESKL